MFFHQNFFKIQSFFFVIYFAWFFLCCLNFKSDMIFVILCYFKVSLVIAFPCKFQGNGCHIYSELIHKTSHEALCSFRPVSCQYGIRGCTQILLYHLMEKHVLECRFKPPNLHAQLSSSSSRDNSLNWCKQRFKKRVSLLTINELTRRSILERYTVIH